MSDTLSLSSVLDALHAQQQQVPAGERGLEKELEELRQSLRDNPSMENDPQFCTRLAWLVQDWPAHSGAGLVPAMSPLLQAGLNQFATTVPGLTNTSLQALMAETATLADRGLVSDIRAVSLQAAALPPAMQTGLMVQAAAEQLTARAGMTSTPTPTPTPTPTVEASGVESAPQPSNPAADRAENMSPVVSVSADQEEMTHAADDGAASATAQPAQQVTAPSPTRREGFWGNPVFCPDAMAARDTQRVTQVAVTAQEQAAVVARNIEVLRHLGRDLLQDIDNVAASHGISVESVIAGTGPGGPFEGISQKFQDMLAHNPEFQAAHEALHLSGRKLNARVSQLDGEAQARGKKTAPTVTNAQRVAAQVALELGRIPGLLPGKSILQEIGAVVLRLVETFRDFFRGQSQDRMRDAGPAPRR